jgi:type IV pilus assembly protein PilP
MSLPKTIKYALTLGIGLLAAATFSAEEPSRTPSEKMKEAVDKLNKAPATIGQSLQGLKDAATAKLKQTLGGSTKPVAKGEPADLIVPQKTSETPAAARAVKEGGRDPFRSPLIPKKINVRVRENLSPLEQKDLGQLKIVGIVSGNGKPVAVLVDNGGDSYIVNVGTAIGINDGTVKTIDRDEVIIEEYCEDVYGARKKCARSMRLKTE